MRLNVSSVVHCSLALISTATSLRLIATLLAHQSGFPEDVLEAFSEVDFSGFNNETGTHQTLIPAIVHIVHQGQDTELTFFEAAAARSAVKFGNADTVYIHSLGSEVTGRYVLELLSDPLFEGEKLVLSALPLFSVEFSGTTVSEQWQNVFPFLVLRETGGVLVSPGTFILGDLHPYLKYEAAMYTDHSEQVKILLTHKCARINEAVVGSHFGGNHPVIKWAMEKPQTIHRFTTGVCDSLICDSLLKSRKGSDLSTLLNYDFLMLNNSEKLNSENIWTMAGNDAAILRLVWFDTTSFVYNSDLPLPHVD